jgi:hypothetical protein
MFDLTVHRRNSKGEVVGKEPYRLEINQGQRRFERPIGSGIWYNEGGDLLPESKIRIEEMEKQKLAAAQAVIDAEAKKVREAAELQAKAAQADSALAENAKLQARIAELEKRAR